MKNCLSFIESPLTKIWGGFYFYSKFSRRPSYGTYGIFLDYKLLKSFNRCSTTLSTAETAGARNL